MEALLCVICRSPKTTLKCGICQDPLCRACIECLDDDAVSLMSVIPPELTHRSYCPNCYAQKVEPQIRAYEEIVEKAEDINLFYIKEGKATRLMKRMEKPFQVNNCRDKNQAIMRLAYLAAKSNFNTLIDIDISVVRTRINSYKTSIWQGSAVPTNLK
jgi:hypothetical protein